MILYHESCQLHQTLPLLYNGNGLISEITPVFFKLQQIVFNDVLLLWARYLSESVPCSSDSHCLCPSKRNNSNSQLQFYNLQQKACTINSHSQMLF